MFGAELLRRHYEPRSVRTLIVSALTDAAIGELAHHYGIEICVIPEHDLLKAGR
jgi:hypothetical protein